MYRSNYKIINNKQIADGYWLLTFYSPEISKNCIPGQFVHIHCGLGTFLRRPFSIAGVQKNSIEIIYKIIGKGTKLLSLKKSGEEVDVLGPLGNGFSIKRNKYPVLVAGGCGIAALRFLAQKLRNKGKIIYGTKNKSELIELSNYKRLDWEIEIATEDGSKGYKGFATELLERELLIRCSDIVYACGPSAMLKKVAEIAKTRNISCQISLEENLACGVGACRGCSIKTVNGYKRVCADGPVFNSEEISWE